MFFASVDRPTAPEGPLKVKCVDQETVTLEWQPPADDGGADIQRYTIEQLDTKKHSWMEVRRRLKMLLLDSKMSIFL